MIYLWAEISAFGDIYCCGRHVCFIVGLEPIFALLDFVRQHHWESWNFLVELIFELQPKMPCLPFPFEHGLLTQRFWVLRHFVDFWLLLYFFFPPYFRTPLLQIGNFMFFLLSLFGASLLRLGFLQLRFSNSFAISGLPSSLRLFWALLLLSFLESSGFSLLTCLLLPRHCNFLVSIFR